jgi:predicted ATPase
LPSPEELAAQEAVALFLDRARAVRPALPSTTETLRAVAAICHRVDGLPLAIELAAARTRLLAPAALLARLDHRLPLLAGGPRDVPARQQTLRQTIAWSYELLAPGVQRLFARLAVFVGGWTGEAAEAVCAEPEDENGDVLAGLEELVTQNLVYRYTSLAGGDRLGMLETIREFAGEQMQAGGMDAAVPSRHAKYFRDFAETAAPRLRTAEQVLWLDRLEQEQDNFRAGRDWAAE